MKAKLVEHKMFDKFFVLKIYFSICSCDLLNCSNKWKVYN